MSTKPTTKSKLSTSRIGMAFKRTTRDKARDEATLAKKLNVDITTMTSGEIIGRLYQRHSTGFWMSWSGILAVATIFGVIY